MSTFSTPRGTQDILPDDWPYWHFVHRHAEGAALEYGYRRVETPTLAETALFARTSGPDSDIVDKEMYSFQDRGGDDLTLRPEGTAPVMRAYLQHGMNKLVQPIKLYYFEHMYRYDRPQRGRFREHHQFGCEAIGSDDAYVDVEMIALLDSLYRGLGLRDFSLQINTIGDAECRPSYTRALTEYLEANRDRLASLDRERLDRNPLRVLDSKESSSQAIIEGAPHIDEYLCPGCRNHWDKLRHGLGCLGIAFSRNQRLVRGLDYYTRTVFEFVPSCHGSQSTLGAGGRYDGLAVAVGGPPVPGVGFGSGIERLVLALKEEDVVIPPGSPVDVYVAHVGAEAEDAALVLAARLRSAGFKVGMSFGSRRLKAQLKQADASGARYAAILGEDELRAGSVVVRSLAAGSQTAVPLEEIEERLRSS
ncbi:MAG: histidine--tRNA ligase [Chloroflexota bacterium]|nr:MAG: histidine--tRNA ligase [Chloroflexota bacterium]